MLCFLVVAPAFSLVASSWGYSLAAMQELLIVAEHGLSCPPASVAAAGGLNSWGSQTLEHRLNSCGAGGLVAQRHVRSFWIRGGTIFLTTEPQGKPPSSLYHPFNSLLVFITPTNFYSYIARSLLVFKYSH